MSETAVVECQRCGQQCTRGFSKGEEDQHFQNLLVHEMVVHNSTMPEFHMHHLKGIQCPHLDFFGQSCPDLVRILLKSPDFS